MKSFLYFSTSLVIFLPACAPCRQVRIESHPPDAVVSMLESEPHGSDMGIPLERWSVIGRTPFNVSSCRLNNELKAGWDNREIFFPEYHGSKLLRFDFEEEVVVEE